jgi:hypothetical protein
MVSLSALLTSLGRSYNPELVTALGDDATFADTVTTALALKQPFDSDLSAIAALTTTAFGRGLLALADAAATRTALGLGSAATANTTAFDAAGAATGLLPYHAVIPGVVKPTASSVAPTVAAGATLFFGVTVFTGTAVNNYIEWDVVLGAGTYSLRTMWQRNTTSGIATISIDGVDLGTTIDMSGVLATNQVTDVSTPSLAAGRHQVRYRAAGKNASATSYAIVLHGLSLTRTGP